MNCSKVKLIKNNMQKLRINYTKIKTRLNKTQCKMKNQNKK